MTCIAAVVSGSVVWMGADSVHASSHALYARDEPKIFQNGDMLIGEAGCVRVGQLLEHAFVPPEHSPRKSDLAYLVTEFIPAVRATIEKQENWTLLIGYRGRLYEVYSDFQIGRVGADYSAIGSGAAVAKGALCVLNQEDPRTRIERALAAAAAHVPGIGPPWVMRSLPP